MLKFRNKLSRCSQGKRHYVQPYSFITVEKLSERIGVSVTNVRLSEIVSKRHPNAPQIKDEVQKAMWSSLVLHFPDQHLSPEEQVLFTKWFGEVEEHPLKSRNGVANHPEILVIENTKEMQVCNLLIAVSMLRVPGTISGIQIFHLVCALRFCQHCTLWKCPHMALEILCSVTCIMLMSPFPKG